MRFFLEKASLDSSPESSGMFVEAIQKFECGTSVHFFMVHRSYYCRDYIYSMFC